MRTLGSSDTTTGKEIKGVDDSVIKYLLLGNWFPYFEDLSTLTTNNNDNGEFSKIRKSNLYLWSCSKTEKRSFIIWYAVILMWLYKTNLITLNNLYILQRKLWRKNWFTNIYRASVIKIQYSFHGLMFFINDYIFLFKVLNISVL